MEKKELMAIIAAIPATRGDKGQTPEWAVPEASRLWKLVDKGEEPKLDSFGQLKPT